MDVWQLLEQRWPFDSELREVPELNARFGMSDATGFASDIRPVFFVGDIDGPAEVLLIGLKPGRNSDANAAFAEEVTALSGDFVAYRRSRTNYFLSRSLNRHHYWATAKAVATVLGEPFPSDPGRYLAEHAMQAELMPFFQHSAVLNDEQFLQARRGSKGGTLAAQVLDILLQAKPWRAILIRYAQTFRVFAGAYDCREIRGQMELLLDAGSVPVFNLRGQYPSDADILDLKGGPRSGHPHALPSSRDRPMSTVGTAAFEGLESFIRSLGTDVTARPRRANGSLVFRRKRNFVTLFSGSRSFGIDVLTSTGWRDRVLVSPGVGLEEAKRLVTAAYQLAGC